jgi:hypothetical protein
MILHKEQVDQMTTEQCETALKSLNKTYPFEKPISTEVWPLVDDITSTLLYLEDRIRYIQQSETAIQANKTRWGNL